MRRIMAVVLAATVVTGLVTGPADARKPKKKKVRTMELVYDSPAIGSADATGTCSGSNGCVEIPIGAKETSLSLTITDSLGLPVAATVGQDQNPNDQFTDVVGKFCGETEEPLQILPGRPVIVWLWVLPSATLQCAGAATTGTVTAKIS